MSGYFLLYDFNCNPDNDDDDMVTLFICRITSIIFQDYVNYVTMIANHENGNSIAETSGTSQIQIQGKIVSKYHNIISMEVMRKKKIIKPDSLTLRVKFQAEIMSGA